MHMHCCRTYNSTLFVRLMAFYGGFIILWIKNSLLQSPINESVKFTLCLFGTFVLLCKMILILQTSNIDLCTKQCFLDWCINMILCGWIILFTELHFYTVFLVFIGHFCNEVRTQGCNKESFTDICITF